MGWGCPRLTLFRREVRCGFGPVLGPLAASVARVFDRFWKNETGLDQSCRVLVLYIRSLALE